MSQKPQNKLDERPRLTRKLRQAINRTQDEIQALRIASGPGYRVKRTNMGQLLELQQQNVGSSSGLVIRRFQVTDIEEKYLVCARTSDDLGSITGTVNVLRPRATWPTDSDSYPVGLSVTNVSVDASQTLRTFTIENNSKTYALDQAIFPAYTNSVVPGAASIIYAARGVKGGIGTDNSGNDINWIDLNVDGRHWSTPMLLTDICVNENGQDVTKTILLARSEVES